MQWKIGRGLAILVIAGAAPNEELNKVMSETRADHASPIRTAWRSWGVGVLIGTLGVAASFGLASLSESYGWVLVLGAPGSAAFAIGYSLRFHRSARSLVALLALTAMLFFLASSDTQFGCAGGLVLAIIAAVPIVAGAVVGSALRELLDPE